MTNKNLLLGRSKPSEKLTREEIAALDKATVPPAPPAKRADRKKGGGPQQMVRRDLLKFAGASSAPAAVSRSPAMASPSPGNVCRGAAAAKWSSSWAEGDGSDNPRTSTRRHR